MGAGKEEVVRRFWFCLILASLIILLVQVFGEGEDRRGVWFFGFLLIAVGPFLLEHLHQLWRRLWG